MRIDPTGAPPGAICGVKGDATILACDDASTDPPARIHRATAHDRQSNASEPLTVSLAAWKTDGGRVFEAPAAPAGTAHG